MRLHEIDLIPKAGESAERQASTLGQRFGPEIRNSVKLYQSFYDSIGITKSTVGGIAAASFHALEGWSPQLAAETRALAETVGAEIVDLMAVIARTEILVADPARERSECSTAVVAGPDQRLRSIQTWDWHDELVPDALIRSHRSARGMKVVTFTEFGAPAKIGLNSAGLSLNFNILHHRSDHIRGGVPVHAIARRILDEATTVDEAIVVAASAEPSASTALTVSDQSRAAASIEISPAGSFAVKSDTDGELLHTNHFIDSTLADGENTTDISTTYVRMDHLEAVARSIGEAGSTTSQMATCLAGTGDGALTSPVCMIPDRSLPANEQWTTLLTVAIDPTNRTMTSFAGAPDQWNAGGAIVVRV